MKSNETIPNRNAAHFNASVEFSIPVQPEKYIHIFKENAAQFSITKSDDILQYILHYYPIELQVIRSFRQSKNTTKEIENELLDAKTVSIFIGIENS